MYTHTSFYGMSMSSIAVFDSGFGGLTVLKELQDLMPGENYIYYGDSANAPYGEKSPEELLELTTAVCEKILQENEVKCFVIACNTTTSEVFEPLTARFPEYPFIGIEPAVRWAAEENPGKHILVLGTLATARGRRLQQRLRELEGKADIEVYAARQIVPYVEGQNTDPKAFSEYLKEAMAPYRRDTDCVVLGCTHFPFVKRELAECFDKPVRFYDAAVHVAAETKDLLDERNLRESSPAEGGSGKAGCIRFMNSDVQKLAREEELFRIYKSR